MSDPSFRESVGCSQSSLREFLTPGEQEKRERCESVLAREPTFREKGAALKTIRDDRLYRSTHKTFERYCRERWRMTSCHARRMIEASSIVNNIVDKIEPIGSIPEMESQVRPLVSLEPDQQCEAWSKAVESASDGHPTAHEVAEAVLQVVGPANRPSPPSWSLVDALDRLDVAVVTVFDKSPSDYRGPLAARLRKLADDLCPGVTPAHANGFAHIANGKANGLVRPSIPRSLVYGSVCSGIEASTVAWHPLGWRPAWFAEIAEFPAAVLSHRYPEVPNHGDFTAIECEPGSIDLLVGGTPCQSFSVAGLRRGMDDERGNLALEFLRLAQRACPTWVVWENVCGVLSIDDRRAFGSIVGGLAELGYGWAYRVLNADGVGVSQRRRRVFLVGHLGNGQPAAAVLFDRASMSGRPRPGRPEWQAVPPRNGGDLPAADRSRSNVYGWTGDETPKHGLNVVPTIRSQQGGEGICVAYPPDIVRRLSPVEVERLMGFEPDYTRVPFRKSKAEDCPDGPRLAALGNSMAVPAMAWIGRRIAFVDSLLIPDRSHPFEVCNAPAS